MALNRHGGVRSALCHNGFTARMAKRHDNANVLTLGARVIGVEIAKDCLDEFLTSKFEGGRHARRVAKITPTG
jgi:ribose 5-phosphate isomerase B